MNGMALTRNLFVVSIALVICADAAAVNLNFMRNTPISRFDDTDLEIFQTATINALDNAADGHVASWENPDSGHNGQIFIISTDDSSGQTCRRIRIVNVAGNLNSNVHHNACLDDVAGWQIVPAPDPLPEPEQ